MKFVDNDYSFNGKTQATKERWKIGSLPSLPSMSLLTVDYTHTPQEDKEYWAKRELSEDCLIKSTLHIGTREIQLTIGQKQQASNEIVNQKSQTN